MLMSTSVFSVELDRDTLSNPPGLLTLLLVVRTLCDANDRKPLSITIYVALPGGAGNCSSL